MTDELKRLLEEFGESWSLPLSSASHNAFGQVMVFYVPSIVVSAVKNGLLEVADGDGPIKVGKSIYGREFRLTNKGREAIGLKPWKVDSPKPVKKVSKTLFD